MIAPFSLAFNPQGTDAYVIDFGGANVIHFRVGANGGLNYVPLSQSPPLSRPYGIALFRVDSTHTFAYITDQDFGDGATLYAGLTLDGDFTGAVGSVTSSFDSPTTIFI